MAAESVARLSVVTDVQEERDQLNALLLIWEIEYAWKKSLETINESEAVTITKPRKMCFHRLRHWRHSPSLQGRTRLWLYPARGTETSHISPLFLMKALFRVVKNPGSSRWAQTGGLLSYRVTLEGSGRWHGIEEAIGDVGATQAPVFETSSRAYVHERLAQWNEISFVGGKQLRYKIEYICSNLSERS